jgi:hypothetical protein
VPKDSAFMKEDNVLRLTGTVLFAVMAMTLSGTRALAAGSCAPPRIKEVKSLELSAAQDRKMGQVFQSTARACSESLGACSEARRACITELTNTLSAQATFDEGRWMRDMLLPYLGQRYAPIAMPESVAPVMESGCPASASELNLQGQKRAEQALRRQALVAEYGRYTEWANALFGQCSAQPSVTQTPSPNVPVLPPAPVAPEQKALAEAAARESQQLEAAEKDKQSAAKAGRLQAEAAQQAAQKNVEISAAQAAMAKQQALDAQVAAFKQESASQAQALQREREERAFRAEQMKKEAAAAKAAQDREASLAAERARQDAQEQAVREREQRKAATKAEKAKLSRQVEVALAQAESTSAAAAGASSPEEREAALQKSEEMKKRAQALKEQSDELTVDDADERARGSVAVAVGLGYAQLSAAEGEFAGLQLGAIALAHLGFWGTAPAEGLASGFEMRALGRFLQSISASDKVRTLEGVLTARYFIGRLGFGLAGEYRLLSTRIGGVEREQANPGIGASLGLALADTPSSRISFNLHALPFLNGGFIRTLADIELSSKNFWISACGGGVVESTGVDPRKGWQASVFAGARLPW